MILMSETFENEQNAKILRLSETPLTQTADTFDAMNAEPRCILYCDPNDDWHTDYKGKWFAVKATVSRTGDQYVMDLTVYRATGTNPNNWAETDTWNSNLGSSSGAMNVLQRFLTDFKGVYVDSGGMIPCFAFAVNKNGASGQCVFHCFVDPDGLIYDDDLDVYNNSTDYMLVGYLQIIPGRVYDGVSALFLYRNNAGTAPNYLEPTIYKLTDLTKFLKLRTVDGSHSWTETGSPAKNVDFNTGGVSFGNLITATGADYYAAAFGGAFGYVEIDMRIALKQTNKNILIGGNGAVPVGDRGAHILFRNDGKWVAFGNTGNYIINTVYTIKIKSYRNTIGSGGGVGEVWIDGVLVGSGGNIFNNIEELGIEFDNGASAVIWTANINIDGVTFRTYSIPSCVEFSADFDTRMIPFLTYSNSSNPNADYINYYVWDESIDVTDYPDGRLIQKRIGVPIEENDVLFGYTDFVETPSATDQEDLLEDFLIRDDCPTIATGESTETTTQHWINIFINTKDNVRCSLFVYKEHAFIVYYRTLDELSEIGVMREDIIRTTTPARSPQLSNDENEFMTVPSGLLTYLFLPNGTVFYVRHSDEDADLRSITGSIFADIRATEAHLSILSTTYNDMNQNVVLVQRGIDRPHKCLIEAYDLQLFEGDFIVILDPEDIRLFAGLLTYSQSENKEILHAVEFELDKNCEELCINRTVGQIVELLIDHYGVFLKYDVTKISAAVKDVVIEKFELRNHLLRNAFETLGRVTNCIWFYDLDDYFNLRTMVDTGSSGLDLNSGNIHYLDDVSTIARVNEVFLQGNGVTSYITSSRQGQVVKFAYPTIGDKTSLDEIATNLMNSATQKTLKFVIHTGVQDRVELGTTLAITEYDPDETVALKEYFIIGIDYDQTLVRNTFYVADGFTYIKDVNATAEIKISKVEEKLTDIEERLITGNEIVDNEEWFEGSSADEQIKSTHDDLGTWDETANITNEVEDDVGHNRVIKSTSTGVTVRLYYPTGTSTDDVECDFWFKPEQANKEIYIGFFDSATARSVIRLTVAGKIEYRFDAGSYVDSGITYSADVWYWCRIEHVKGGTGKIIINNTIFTGTCGSNQYTGFTLYHSVSGSIVCLDAVNVSIDANYKSYRSIADGIVDTHGLIVRKKAYIENLLVENLDGPINDRVATLENSVATLETGSRFVPIYTTANNWMSASSTSSKTDEYNVCEVTSNKWTRISGTMTQGGGGTMPTIPNHAKGVKIYIRVVFTNIHSDNGTILHGKGQYYQLGIILIPQIANLPIDGIADVFWAPADSGRINFIHSIVTGSTTATVYFRCIGYWI